MFYHIVVGITGLTNWINKNKTRDELLSTFICPFIEKEITIVDGAIFNMSSFGNLTIYKTDRPIDSEWPIKKSDFIEESFGKKEFVDYKYKQALQDKLEEIATDVTEELYKEAINLIKSGKYEELRDRIEREKKEKYSFFCMSF